MRMHYAIPISITFNFKMILSKIAKNLPCHLPSFLPPKLFAEYPSNVHFSFTATNDALLLKLLSIFQLLIPSCDGLVSNVAKLVTSKVPVVNALVLVKKPSAPVS